MRSVWRTELLSRLPKGKVGVEVGVWKGNFSKKLLEYTHPSQLYLIDPWAYQPSKRSSLYGNKNQSQKLMDGIFERVCSHFEDADNVSIFRMTSEDAAQLFDEGEVDWVYIDGDHSYEGVINDLRIWTPLVSDGGIICGDDYQPSKWSGVTKAVDEYFQWTQELIGTQYLWKNTSKNRRKLNGI